jgi:GrpB-like predicted nucleotidyltransferase (UPF0157 family)
MSAVTLVDYRPDWPARFEAAADELRAVFEGHAVQVEHVGSTAVVGLCAKPVIDILLGAEDLTLVEQRVQALARRGYRHRSEYEHDLPDRRYFVRDADADLDAMQLRIHLHAVVRGGRFWREQLAFRDALRADTALAKRYAELKRALAARYAEDKAGYTEAKGPFVAEVVARFASQVVPREPARSPS